MKARYADDPPVSRVRTPPRLSLRQSVLAAATALYRERADAVLVVDESTTQAVGVFTPRDLVAVVALGFDPGQLTLGEWLVVGEASDAQGCESWIG